jgi:hypothetical protein
LLICRTHFLGGRADARTPFGNQDAVGHRQLRRPVTVEEELALDGPLAHLPGRSLLPLDKNSSSAWATTEEIVRLDSAAWARTRATSSTGSLTVNTTLGCGTSIGPPSAARST